MTTECRQLRSNSVSSSDLGTIENTQKPNRRIPLGVKATSSLIKLADDHDCNTVDSEFTLLKVQERVFGCFIRFAVSYYLECQTFRGQTSFNGTISTCGGCNSCHGSLTPNLCTTKTQAIFQRIISQEKLSSIDEAYTKAFFSLNSSEVEKLQQHELSEQELIKHVPKKYWNRTFQGTVLEAQLNTTFQQSKESNRIDSSLEPALRKKEDELAKLCTLKETTPQEGTKELFKQYQEMLAERLKNIESRFKGLEEFQQAHEKVNQWIELFNGKTEEQLQSQEADYAKFVKDAEALILCKNALAAKQPGVSLLVKNFITQVRSDYHLLTMLVRNYHSTNIKAPFWTLYTKAVEKGRFKAAQKQLNLKPLQEKLALRQQEIIVQQQEVDKILSFLDEEEALTTAYLGVLDVNGNRRKPTFEEAASQIIQMIGQKRDMDEKENIPPNPTVQKSSKSVLRKGGQPTRKSTRVLKTLR